MTQWAYTSSFYDTVGLYLLIWWHSGPIPPHFMTQWAYTSSFYDTVGLYLLILWHSGPIPPHLMTQWAYTSSFYDTVGPYPLIWWHSGPIPPHLLTKYGLYSSQAKDVQRKCWKAFESMQFMCVLLDWTIRWNYLTVHLLIGGSSSSYRSPSSISMSSSTLSLGESDLAESSGILPVLM